MEYRIPEQKPIQIRGRLGVPKDKVFATYNHKILAGALENPQLVLDRSRFKK
ncbi:MAG: hypothetical protein Q7U74_14725 [Saprospiraceae bacterium]|nr:hypothetical protein [Saprospiraceae bacterium]